MEKRLQWPPPAHFAENPACAVDGSIRSIAIIETDSFCSGHEPARYRVSSYRPPQQGTLLDFLFTQQNSYGCANTIGALAKMFR